MATIVGSVTPVAVALAAFLVTGAFTGLADAQAVHQGLTYVCNPTLADPIPPLATNATLNVSLIHSAVITRHGSRTPQVPFSPSRAEWRCNLTQLSLPIEDDAIDTIPSPSRLYRKNYMATKMALTGDCMTSALTARGAAQLRSVGAHLRSAYVETLGFLPEALDPRNATWLFLRSTDTQRTFLSVESLMAGLYPDSGDGLNITRVLDIHSADEAYDNMTPHASLCPRFADLEADLKDSPLVQAYMASDPVVALTAQIEELLNATDPDGPPLGGFQWKYLMDNFQCRICEGVALPAGYGGEVAEGIIDVAVTLNAAKIDNATAARLGIGTFLGELAASMDAAVSGGSDERLAIYSGHDSTIAPVLAALGVWDRRWPPYASTIILETYRQASPATGVFVRMLYNGEPMLVAGCEDELCPFDAFMSTFRAASLSFANFTAECKRDAPAPTTTTMAPSEGPVDTGSSGDGALVRRNIVIVSIVGFLGVLGCLVGGCYWRRQRQGKTATPKTNYSELKA